MSKLIGFMGVIGSGKGHQQKLLMDSGYVALDFADELKDMVSDLVGFNIREDYDWFKEHVVGIKRPKGKINQKIATLNSRILEWSQPEIVTGRKMLQRMGTEVMRKRDPEYWSKAWTEKAIDLLMAGKDVVASDVRFYNEMEAIRRLGGQRAFPVEAKIIFCDHKSYRYNGTSTHPSEKLAQELIRYGQKDLTEVTLHICGG